MLCRCAHAAPCRDTKIVLRYKNPCRACFCAVSRALLRRVTHASAPCRARATARPSSQARSCHSLARSCALPVAIQSYYVTTRAGKWAVAHPTSFPARFFSLFVLLIVKPHNFFFSNLPVEPQKIIIIIIIIFCFTYCKTNRKKKKKKKNFLNIFFQNLPVACTKSATPKMQ